MAEQGRCGTCRWAFETPNPEQVACHFEPPDVFPMQDRTGNVQFLATWRVVQAMVDFCSHHAEGEAVRLSKIVRVPPGGVKEPLSMSARR
jgi:hypothetical protein